MAEIPVTANWIFVGSRTYERMEVYGPGWSKLLSGVHQIVPAPFGGPILAVKDQMIYILKASGHLIAHWPWKNSRILSCGWSNMEEVVMVVEDGTVFVYDLFGSMVKTFGMGQEAKDLKIAEAKIFVGKVSTGIAVLTNSKRFFVVNNIREPRVRKMFDVDWSRDGRIVWDVMTDEKQAKILTSQTAATLRIITQTDSKNLPIDLLHTEDDQLLHLAVSFDSSRVALCCTNGFLWMGSTDRKVTSLRLNSAVDLLFWCSNDALLAISGPMCKIISTASAIEDAYCPEFIAGVQEIDGTRIFSTAAQELIREVPQAVLNTFDLRIQESPSSHLRFAFEEFSLKSHRADEYLRQISGDIDVAVATCTECAGHIFDPLLQKELLSAARFGKSFSSGSSASSVEAFYKMCVTLRILNSLRDHRVGIPLTIEQYSFLTARVVIDRLLVRRLYPLALAVCDLLKMSVNDGSNRVLVHWACYKVASGVDGVNDNSDAAVAKLISQRLGHHPQLSDIASKAVECGKKDLAVKLLEHEIRIHKQVPLLLKLGEGKKALERALKSGNRDLSFSVILYLRDQYSSAEFHMILRKFSQATVLYERYCRENEKESLEDWYIQEDDFASQAKLKFEQSFDTNSHETRMARLHNVSEDWLKARAESNQVMTEEYQKLLKHQKMMEDKLGRSFLGCNVSETLYELFLHNETKLAERLKSDLKVTDKRFTWCRIRAWAMLRQWQELKKYAKQKKHPVSMTQVVHIVKEIAGDRDAKEFLTDEFVTNPKERVDLYSEFGMFLEAANAAFLAKSIESLNMLESVCGGKDEVLRAIAAFKSKLQ